MAQLNDLSRVEAEKVEVNGKTMEIIKAQQDMRAAYVGGAPGVLVSGLVWVLAGGVATFTTFQTSIIVFFLGGMFIHPLSIVVSKFVFNAPLQAKDNPFARLAFETTITLFVGLFLAFMVSQLKEDWFYPIMLLMIGARYFVFSTIYGNRLFWLLGLSLIALGGVLIFYLPVPSNQAAIAGGVLELLFSIVIFGQARFSRAP